MTSPFSQPATPTQGDSFSLKEHPEWNGALALVYPDKVNEARKWNDRFDAAETVSADIVLLDRQGPDGQPIVLHDTMVFPQVMVSQLKANLKAGNAMVLGRITQERTKNGFDAWKFGDFSPQDQAYAEQYVAAHPRNTFAPAGAATPPPPVQQQWQPPVATAPLVQQTWPTATGPAPTTWTPPASAVDPGIGQFLLTRGVPQEAINSMDANALKNLAQMMGWTG